MKKVKNINVCAQYEFEAHNVNGNEENAPKNVNGRNYVSGQKARYMLIETIKEEDSQNRNKISTSDGVTSNIAEDLRSDLIGYMNTDGGSYATKRTSVVKVSFALAEKVSDFFEDLFVRFKTNPNSEDVHTEQRINNKTYSESDIVNFNYALDCTQLSTSEYFTYDDNKFVERFYIKHVDEVERKKRALLFLKGTSYLVGLANQSRNAVDNVPKKVFICFDDRLTFKKYFQWSEIEQKEIISYLESKKIPYFIGGEGYMTVTDAFEKAYAKLDELELEDYSIETLTQEEVAKKYSTILTLDKANTKAKKAAEKAAQKVTINTEDEKIPSEKETDSVE